MRDQGVTSPFSHELQRLVGRFEILTAASFVLFDHIYRTTRGKAQEGFALNARARDLLSRLLYQYLHCRQGPAGKPALPLDPIAARDFLESLSLANRGEGPWQAGWKVVSRLPNGEIDCEKYGLRWILPATATRPSDSEDTIYVRVGREQRELFPGYYMALGNGDDDFSAPITRTYWNVSAAGAAVFVQAATTLLNEARVSFRLKILKVPSSFPRTDAAVIYAPRAQYSETLIQMRRLFVTVHRYLSPDTSAFVKPLGAGVGAADDRATATSFGQHVSGVLADAMAVTETVRHRSTAGKLRTMERRMLSSGIDPERPYVTSGLTDVFQPFDE